jgi:acyl carrier protein
MHCHRNPPCRYFMDIGMHQELFRAMKHISQTEAELRIIEIVRDEALIPTQTIVDPDANLARDLRIDGDDITFLIIPRIEKEFGRKLSLRQWSQIGSPREIARAIIDPDSEER